MNTLIKVGDKSFAIEQTLANLVRKTGSMVSFPEYARARGIIKPKDMRVQSPEAEAWRNASKAHKQAAVIFSKRVKQLGAAIPQDEKLKGTKAKIDIDEHGEVTYANFVYRRLTKADQKAKDTAEVTNAKAQLAEAQSQIEAMRAALAAAGINLPS
jgi:hypothetical protein